MHKILFAVLLFVSCNQKSDKEIADIKEDLRVTNILIESSDFHLELQQDFLTKSKSSGDQIRIKHSQKRWDELNREKDSLVKRKIQLEKEL